MTTGDPGAPNEEELRAAYEAQLKQVRVEHILLDNVVALINLGMRRTGLAPGTEDERDPAQVRMAIESVRALLPQLEAVAPREIGQIRDALSQLQMAFVRIGGAPPPASGPPPAQPSSGSTPSTPTPGSAPGPGPAEPPAGKPGEPGPAQRSGRLWVPGS